MYKRGRDSGEFFMFINSTVHRGGVRALTKRGVDTIDTINFTENLSRMMETFAEKVCHSPLGRPLNLSMGP